LAGVVWFAASAVSFARRHEGKAARNKEQNKNKIRNGAIIVPLDIFSSVVKDFCMPDRAARLTGSPDRSSLDIIGIPVRGLNRCPGAEATRVLEADAASTLEEAGAHGRLASIYHSANAQEKRRSGSVMRMSSMLKVFEAGPINHEAIEVTRDEERMKSSWYLAGVIFLALLATGCGGSSDGEVSYVPGTTTPVTGLAVPSMASLDSVMARLMSRWDLPGGSLAVVKDGRLVYARGFGWADRANGISVQPYSLFRIASVTKVITSVAIMKLYQDGRLAPDGLDTLVFGPSGILNDAAYSSIKDPRALTITVRNLLQHTGGWNSSLGYDPQYDELNIARAMGVPAPPDGPTIVRYMLRNKDLDFDPGTQYHCSNFGYNVLGRVIEKLSNMTYEAYVRQYVLAFSGIGDMVIGGNLANERVPNEVVYYDTPGLTKTSIYGTGQTVPYSYGGLNLRAMDAHGGWIATATDLLRFMTSVDGFGSRPSLLSPSTIALMLTKPTTISSTVAMGWDMGSDGSWSRSGALSAGTFAYLLRRADGVEWAVVFNRLPMDASDPSGSLERFNNDFMATLPAAFDAITEWPGHDLF
jgi:CubicO group peptidase (beta-lactamase class C family)